MYDFHKDKERYFKIQKEVTEEYIIPFLSDFFNIGKPQTVLEIGSAEAGVLKAFTDKGHNCVGIELSSNRVETAKTLMAKELEEKKVRFFSRNIYDINPEEELEFKFDLIILKDVIEHIHDQEKFISILKNFLKKNGKVFFAFPPWQMPFGGHQQVAANKLISTSPYIHLLPMFLYKFVLKIFGETDAKIESLTEIKETGISIERFEKIIKNSKYNIVKKKFYLFNPIYKWKFDIKPREQFSFISSIPYIRNFFTFGVYYIIE
ncbi:MAG TPA: class I SAM-dependent methyltransferase [Hydrogenothermaceae bacterium]|nr:class I SAM-dependent methyltransferase [Hydrogenothermaceae bacterium]